jgi:glutamate carboxypeptidase
MTAAAPQTILDWLAGQRPAMLALLEEVVNIDSGSYDRAGVEAVGERFRRFFEGRASRFRSTRTTPSVMPSRRRSPGRAARTSRSS